MKTGVTIFIAAMILFVAGGLSQAAVTNVTGNPGADGFTAFGNSLENGIYVRGNGNYGYDTYSAGFAIQTGSNLINSYFDPDWQVDMSWMAGDTVLAVGGIFQSITADEAGWSAFTGLGVNSLLSSVTDGPKLQAKFGNNAAAWTTSPVAPDAGNSLGSLSYGDGDLINGVAIQIRTGTYYYDGGPAFVPGINQPGFLGWDTNAGTLMHLAKDSHIEWTVSSSVIDMNRNVARMIWAGATGSEEPASWELLLNVSLIDRLNPGSAALLPAIGDMVLMTVQNNDSQYTDALISTIPEPTTLLLLGLGGLLLRKRKI